MKSRHIAAHLELLLASLIVGSSVVAGKWSTTQLPIFLSQTASTFIAILVLIPLCLIRFRNDIRGILRLTRQDLKLLVLQAFLGMFLFRVLMLYGLRYATAADSGILTSLTPAAVALLSFWLLKERPTARLILGIACSFMGLIAIQLPQLLAASSYGHSSFGGVLLIIGAVMGEASLTIIRKMHGDNVTPMLGTTYVTLFSFLMFLPLSLPDLWKFDITSVSQAQIGFVLYYGLFVTALAYVLWFGGVSKLPAATAAAYTAFIPVSTLLLSYVVLHEPYSPAHLAGIGFVVTGLLLIIRPKREVIPTVTESF